MANDKAKTNGKQRTSAGSSKTSEQRKIRNSQRGDGITADWFDASDTSIASAVRAVAARGCAIQFGYTRDLASYRIRIVGDGDPFDEYLRGNEDVNLWLDSITADYTIGD